MIMPSRSLIVGAMALSAMGLANTAAAHHGWAWTIRDEWFELSGTLTEIFIGQPHPTLAIDDGENVWTVELAPVAGTVAAGFTEDTTAPGDMVTVIGHRAAHANSLMMKAVRVVAGGETYDVYPDFAARYDAGE